MSLNIRPSTSIERQLIVTEAILNSTDKVSKVSDEAILSGISAGISKVSGKAEKDIILAVSQLFPDTAFGDQLDLCARHFGVSPRFGAIGSSTYVRIFANPGTQYLSNTHQFTSSAGITFTLDSDFTVPSVGWGYARVSSIQTGLSSRVDPLTISQVSPEPSGHISVLNEYRADGGRDIESDVDFRNRIKQGANILAKGTLAQYEQLFIATNPKVFKVYNSGRDLAGNIVLSVSTQNGSSLTQTELDELLSENVAYFPLSVLRPFGERFLGLKIINAVYGYVDVSFRCSLSLDVNPDDVRRSIQIGFSKYLDPRNFDPTKKKVEWDNLLEIVKNTPGVLYVPDQYFYPRIDLTFSSGIIPRMRGFLMLDINGQIISDLQGVIQPQYYPQYADFSFQSTVLNIL